MIKILICDDEPLWTEKIVNSINNVIDVEYELTTFSNANDLMNHLSENYADIVLIDIQLPEINGIDIAKEIYKSNKHIQIIFMSISADYIQDVFSVKPVYYLVKPFIDEKVKEALNIAFENLEYQKQSVSFTSKGKTIKLQISDIMYVESEKRMVKFHHNDEITECFTKLDEVKEALPNYFVRCHQSYLVNINYISRISNNQIELNSGKVIPVAKARFSSAKKEIIEFWENQI